MGKRASSIAHRGRRWRALLLSTAFAGATVAGATPDPLPAALLAPLRTAMDTASQHGAREDWRACEAALAPLEARVWPYAADERVAWPLLHLFGCRTAQVMSTRAGLSVVTRQHREQWQASRQQGMAVWPRMRQSTLVWAWIDKWSGAEAADVWLEDEVLAPLLREQHAGSTAAMTELTQLIETLYGHGARLSRIEALRQRLASALGETSPPVLAAARVLAVTHRRAGRPDQALAVLDPAYQQALQTQAGTDLLAWLDSERALVLERLGRVQEALDAQHRVAAYWARHPQPERMRGARAEQNLARLQLATGRLDLVPLHARRAADWVADAGALSTQLEQENITARLALAVSQLRLGQPGALQALRQALAPVQTSDFFLQAAPLEELWLAAEQQGETELAGWAQQGLQAYLDRWVQPLQTEALLGELMRARREPGQAEAARWQAVALGSMGRDPGLEALALFDAANAQADRAPRLAVALYKRACRALHRARIDVTSAELLRVGFARFESALRRFVTLLLDQGRLHEAEQALAFLHEGELDAFERRQAQLSGPPPLDADEQAWDAAVSAIGQALLQTALALERPLDEQAPLHHPGKARLAEAQQAQAQAGDALARISQPLLHTAGDGAPPPTHLPPPTAGTAELAFAVGAQQLDLLLRLPSGEVKHWRRPLPRATLAREVQQLRQLLERPDSEITAVQRQAQSLHQHLLAPALAQLPPGVLRLQLRPDGVLHYLPFAALHDGRHYLAERFVLSQRSPAPGASDAPNSGPPLGLGRVRVGADAAAEPALPAVARELQALQRWPGSQLAQDAGFSEASLRAGLARKPALVHLASHFHRDPGGDGASYLLLGDDSRLSVDQLARLPWQGVRLALLSGCQTALPVDGQARAGGLAARLRLAGVEQVLATQWRIADAAAADWVSAFYAGLATQDLARQRPRADWLAQAQQQWLHTHRHSQRAHPHYWAAYAWFE